MKTSRFLINGIVNARSHKRLLNKGKLLAAALPMCLALASHSALAIDAARTVHSGADTIDSVQFLDLVSLSVPTQETSRQCAAVASSQAQNPGGIGNQIEFALFRRDGGTFVGGNVNGRRVFELNDATGNDNGDFVEVSATDLFVIPPADGQSHAIVLRARKVAGNTVVVNRSSLSVMCFDNGL